MLICPVPIIVYSVIALVTVRSGAMTKCGGKLTDKTGVIASPNFPHRFPFPIDCTWVISSREGEKIRLYMTQVYVRRGLSVTEYDFYRDEGFHVGTNELGSMTYLEPRSSVVSNRSYVVVRFRTSYNIVNMHVRVEDDLTHVFGFNITYAVTNRSEPLPPRMCSVSGCSYLGNCYASLDYTRFACHCFDTFFGDQCQFGPKCDPTRGINECLNGGSCKYFSGAVVNRCICSPGYSGERCETFIPNKSKVCTDGGCLEEPSCRRTKYGNYTCQCRHGYTQIPGKRMCSKIVTMLVRVFLLLKTKPQLIARMDNSKESIAYLKMKVTESLIDIGVRNLTLTVAKGISLGYPMEFQFFLPQHKVTGFKKKISTKISNGSLDGLRISNVTYLIRINPSLEILSVRVTERPPLLLGQFVTIVCTAQGSPDITFTWYKINYPPRATWWTGEEYMEVTAKGAMSHHWVNTVPNVMTGVYKSILNIRYARQIEEGIYFCVADDVKKQQTLLSTSFYITRAPELPDTFISRTLHEGNTSIIKCTALDDTNYSFVYRWYRNGLDLVTGVNMEEAEDLEPVGSWLIIGSAKVDANYTCMVRNGELTSNLTAFVYVVPAGNKSRGCVETQQVFRTNDDLSLVKWLYTAGGGLDIHRCPHAIGHITRRCVLSEGVPTWSAISTSLCVSQTFDDIRQQLTTWHIGYYNLPLRRIIENVFHGLTESNTLFAGDLSVALDILNDGLTYYAINRRGQLYLHDLLKVLSELISSRRHISGIQREAMVMPRVIWLMDRIMSLDLQMLFPMSASNMTTDAIDYLPLFDSSADVVISADAPPENAAAPAAARLNKSAPGDHRQYVVVVRNLADDLDIHLERFLTGELLLPMVIIYKSRGRQAGTQVTLSFATNESQFGGYEQMECVELNLDPGNWGGGRWISAGETVWKGGRVTCVCTSPGIYALAAVNLTQPELEISSIKVDSRHTLMLTASILLIVLATLTSVTQLLAYRRMKECILYMCQVNLSISILIHAVVFLVCLTQPPSSDSCVLTRIVWYYFYLASFSFLVTESICRLIDISQNTVFIMSSFKILLIGWGFPSLGMICVIMVYLMDSFYHRNSCSALCGLVGDVMSSGSHLAAMIVPVLVIIMTYVIMSVMSMKSVSNWNAEHRKKEKRKQTVSLVRSSILIGLLVLSGVLGIAAKLSHHPHTAQTFLAANFLLGGFLFSFRCICDFRVRSYFSFKKGTKMSSDTKMYSDNTRKKFIGTGSTSASGYDGSSTTDTYMQHKFHLRSLLGSGEYYQTEPVGNVQTYPHDDVITDKRHSDSLRSRAQARGGVRFSGDLFNITQNPAQFDDTRSQFAATASVRPGCDSKSIRCAICTESPLVHRDAHSLQGATNQLPDIISNSQMNDRPPSHKKAPRDDGNLADIQLKPFVYDRKNNEDGVTSPTAWSNGVIHVESEV